MKKMLPLLLFALSMSVKMFPQKNTSDPEIDKFLSSQEFNKVISNPHWTRLGTVNRKMSYAYPLGENIKGVAINIVLVNKESGKVTAVIEAVQAPATGEFFPDNARYAMALRNYEKYDLVSLSGVIDYYDLNYENHHAGTITVSGSKVVSWDTYSIPEDVLSRYSNLRKAPHYCDANQNGNVTFTECYKCLKKACSSDPTCITLCDIVNFLGGYCTGSMVTSCIYLSMVY